jgi:hypothetical protein
MAIYQKPLQIVKNGLCSVLVFGWQSDIKTVTVRRIVTEGYGIRQIPWQRVLIQYEIRAQGCCVECEEILGVMEEENICVQLKEWRH